MLRKPHTTNLLEGAPARLRSRVEETRYAAVKELSRIQSVDVLPHLLKAVGDTSLRIREEALQGICSFPQEVIFPRLEDLLRDQEHAHFRTAAMEAFPRYGKEATPWLLGLLKDGDEEVRMFSAAILGDIRDPAAVEDLINALNDPDDNVRHASAEGLGKIGDARAVRPLIDCLHQDFWIQYPAIIALGRIGDPCAIEHLLPLLDDEMLRQAVVESLGQIGDVAAIPALTGALSCNDPALRNDTIASLVNIQRMAKPKGGCLPGIKHALRNGDLIEHLLRSLQDGDLEIRRNAVIALGWLKDKRAVAPLVALMTSYDLEEYVVGALVSIGDGAVPCIIEGLHNPDPRIRACIIRCIDWIGNRQGVEACIPCLKDENIEVRNQAAMAMAGWLDLAAIEDGLFESLSDPEPEMRSLVAEILGRSSSKRLVDRLLPELFVKDRSRRLLAITILGRLKNPRTCSPLKGLLEDPSDEIRSAAYIALSSLTVKGLSEELLARGITDASPRVRKAVASSITAETGTPLEGTLLVLLGDQDQDVRLAAIEALGRIGDPCCAEDLVRAFSDTPKHLGLAILRAMGNLRTARSLRFLTGFLKRHDRDLKRVAIESLGMLKDKGSIPDLIVAMDDCDWSIRSAAVQALAQIGDRRCSGALRKKLKDPDDIVRKEAVRALGMLGDQAAANALLPFLHDEHVQDEVLNSLETLGIPDLVAFAEHFRRSNARLKCRLIALLGRLREPGMVEFLTGILDEEFFTVRCWIAKALGNLGDPRAIPPLRRLRKEDPSEEVRKEATAALKKLGDRR
ncbi:MAG: HEAT repeat domain-containing protein [bacterium]